MHIYPPELEIDENEGFSPDKDLFGRAELGKGMTNLVTNISDPLVIAFDGEWGSGKTTFLKMWAGELRKKDFPVIYFDAFENDYADDAFAVLVREVIALAEASKSKKKLVKDFKDQSIKLGSLLLGSAAKIGIRSTLQLLTAGTVNYTDIEDFINKASDGSDDYMLSFLSEPQKQKAVVTQFRETLKGLPALLAPPANNDQQKPLVFIIDELDRCKPLFALQILERVKHFMSVPNVHFVLGVHLKQLQRSVNFAYGADVSATTYLQKFINLTIVNTDTTQRQHEEQITKYIKHLKEKLELTNTNEIHYTIEFIKHVALQDKYSLRMLERIFTNIVLATVFAVDGEFRISSLIGGLCILKVVEPELFLKAKQGQLKYKEVAVLFGFSNLSPGEANYKEDSDRDYWEYTLAEEVPERLRNFDRNFVRRRFNSRKDMLTFTASSIIDRLKPNE